MTAPTTTANAHRLAAAREWLDTTGRAATCAQALMNMAQTVEVRTERLADLIAAELAEANAFEDVITYAPADELDALEVQAEHARDRFRRHAHELPGWRAILDRRL